MIELRNPNISIESFKDSLVPRSLSLALGYTLIHCNILEIVFTRASPTFHNLFMVMGCVFDVNTVGGSKTQVTGQVRSQVRSQVTGQVTGRVRSGQ